jgi:hypothetical protein
MMWNILVPYLRWKKKTMKLQRHPNTTVVVIPAWMGRRPVQHNTEEAKVEAWINLEDDNDNVEGSDLEELGKQAHAAVDATFADEPLDDYCFRMWALC